MTREPLAPITSVAIDTAIKNRIEYLEAQLMLSDDKATQWRQDALFLYQYAATYIVILMAARENPGVKEALENLEVALRLGVQEWPEVKARLDENYRVDVLRMWDTELKEDINDN